MNPKQKLHLTLAMIAVLIASCATTDQHVTDQKYQSTPKFEQLLGKTNVEDPETLVEQGKLNEAAMLYLNEFLI